MYLPVCLSVSVCLSDCTKPGTHRETRQGRTARVRDRQETGEIQIANNHVTESEQGAYSVVQSTTGGRNP